MSFDISAAFDVSAYDVTTEYRRDFYLPPLDGYLPKLRNGEIFETKRFLGCVAGLQHWCKDRWAFPLEGLPESYAGLEGAAAPEDVLARALARKGVWMGKRREKVVLNKVDHEMARIDIAGQVWRSFALEGSDPHDVRMALDGLGAGWPGPADYGWLVATVNASGGECGND